MFKSHLFILKIPFCFSIRKIIVVVFVDLLNKKLTRQIRQKCDAFLKPLEIPEYQVLRFQDAVLEWNEAVRKRWERGQATKAPERQKFVKMTLETLASLKERQFGGKP